MITGVLDLKRPSRCERTGKIGCRECHGGAGCDVLIQNLRRYGWSESNTRYELLGPEGTRTKIVGPLR